MQADSDIESLDEKGNGSGAFPDLLPTTFCRTFNRAARLLFPFAVPRLDAGRILDSVRDQVGLHDFGSPRAHEAFSVLVGSMEKEGRLSPFGRFAASSILHEAVSTRLQVVDAFHRDPSLQDEPLRRPLIIVGPTRTGTTMLYQLLATDPQFRWFPFWESLFPAPPDGSPDPEGIRRRRVARRKLRFINQALPNMEAIHPLGLDEPEECAGLQRASFGSFYYSLHAHIPSYERWLEDSNSEGLREAFSFYRKGLQWIQRERPGGGQHWLLKSPAFTPFVGILANLFPDAVLVQTHRNPVESVPSTCSLFASFLRAFTTNVAPHEIGELILREARRDMERNLEARDSLPPG
ncbi:MAG: sulfotransferase, partial [Verrucomicrobiota bacterium]